MVRAKFHLQRSNLTPRLGPVPKASDRLEPFTEFMTNKKLLNAVLLIQWTVTNSVRDTPRWTGHSSCRSGVHALLTETCSQNKSPVQGESRRGAEERSRQGFEEGKVPRGGEEGERRPSKACHSSVAGKHFCVTWVWGNQEKWHRVRLEVCQEKL